MEVWEYGIDPKTVMANPDKVYNERSASTFMERLESQIGTPWKKYDWPVGCIPDDPEWFTPARFVWWAYYLEGIDLGSTIADQVANAQSYLILGNSKDSLRPGDLVFFTSTRSVRVAIYQYAGRVIGVLPGRAVASVPIEEMGDIFLAYRPTVELP